MPMAGAATTDAAARLMTMRRTISSVTPSAAAVASIPAQRCAAPVRYPYTLLWDILGSYRPQFGQHLTALPSRGTWPERVSFMIGSFKTFKTICNLSLLPKPLLDDPT
eukprot:4349539-Pleurochrysis_carterae.AAC.3